VGEVKKMSINRSFSMQFALGVALAVAGFAFVPSADAEVLPSGPVPDHYIIKLVPGATAAAVANAHGLTARHVYSHAYHGFAAIVPAARLQRLRNDRRVAAVYADRYVSILKCASPPCGGPGGGGGGDGGGGSTQPPQIVPTGIQRIHADLSSTQAGDGSGNVVIDVAVIDTGIFKHDDLNVAGGYNCNSGPTKKWNDGNGHGTHVSGTIGALDNGTGVVGVAPGARLWAVRVLNNAGSGFSSDVICGIDWVTAHADTIKVANMSLGGSGSDGACTADPEHEAICNAVAAGVTFVVAAGNSSADAATDVPAAYDEVITVSALADFDGVAGGLGAPTCRADEDDTFANFSNYGADVDLIAPGVCILSTWNDNGYNTISGTSMAAPHVTGAVALYLSTHPGTSPAGVKAALEGAGAYDWSAADDPDGIAEPLLNVSGF
jgi:subtilisin